MPATVRERVLAAFFATLEPLADEVYGLSVERNRDTDVTTFPTLVMLDGRHEADDSFATGVTRYLMPVTVLGFVEAAGEAETPHAKWDELYGLVVQAALADRTLGGLAVDVTEQADEVELDRAEGHTPGGGTTLQFLIEFWTRQGDPFTVGP